MISWSRIGVSIAPLSASFVLPGLPLESGFMTSSPTIAAEEALVHALLTEHGKVDEVLRLAVLLADDHVLGDVDETPRQVARVGRAERRVGETLAGAVGRDEVLEHRQALHEVGLDRALDDLALRIRHQAAHTRELTDLLEGSTRSRVGHHVDRVELEQRLLHGVGRPRRSPPSRCSRSARGAPPR